MISRLKRDILRSHILNEGASPSKTYVFKPNWHIFGRVLEEMKESGLVESLKLNGSPKFTRITPKGALCYLREVGRAVGKKSGRDYFKEFIKRNPDFLDRCGPVQRTRVEKYLVLGFMPPFSKKPSPGGEEGKESLT